MGFSLNQSAKADFIYQFYFPLAKTSGK